jgi:PAS domain S-box-containing protein
VTAQPDTSLQKRDPEYRAIFEASSDGLVINDAETGIVLEANPAFCRMHGYDRMAGLHPSAFIHPESLQLFHKYVRSIHEGKEFRTRARDIRRDGTVFDVEVLGRGFMYQGRFALLGVVRDVTQQVRAYEVLEERVAERTREVDRRRQVAEALRDLLTVVNSQRSLDEILAQVAAQAKQLLGSQASAIYVPVREQAEELLRVGASSGLDDGYVAARVPVGMPASGMAFARRRPVGVYDVPAALAANDPEDESPQVEDRTSHLRALRLWGEWQDLSPGGNERVQRLGTFAEGFRAILAVPLAARDESYGALTLYYRDARAFGHDEVWLATAFADQAALAIQNARLHEESEQRRRELEALYQADAALHRSLRLDQVLEALVGAAIGLLGADAAALWGSDPQDPKRTIPLASRGVSAAYLQESILRSQDPAVQQMWYGHDSYATEDATKDPHFPPAWRAAFERERHLGLLSTQVSVGEQVFGTFTVVFHTPHHFVTAEKRLLSTLAQRAALAIQNARLYEQAQQTATLEERQRLARELHDAVTQTLFSTALIAEVIPNLWDIDPVEARQRLEELRRLTRGALAEMRTLLVELRPAALTELSLADLLRQLGEAAAGRTRLKIDVDADRQLGYQLPADLRVVLYRIAQEALNNTIKHAQAQRASIRLERTDDGLMLQIEDDGKGFDPALVPVGHFGVAIMRERAQGVGAVLDVASRPGAGTRVAVRCQATG